MSLDPKILNANFLIVDDNAGTGKTTIVARSVFDLAGEGYHIFEYRCLSTPNLDHCAAIFNPFVGRFIIFCDDFADHVSAFTELHKRITRSDYLVVGLERSYRINYIIQTLAGIAFKRHTLNPFSPQEAKDLLIKMQKDGLTAAKDLIKQSVEIAKDPIAIAVCRAMNDFRPIEDIIESLLRDSDSGRKERYLACALAAHCYKVGLSYSLLCSAFDRIDLQKQFLERDRLPVSYSDSTKDYVIPTNPILGQRVLRDIAEKNSDLMFEVYCTLGAYLAPYVNRNTIRSRTPEARIAQRLFDYDDVVSEFIPTKSESFYLRMKNYWEWNSR